MRLCLVTCLTPVGSCTHIASWLPACTEFHQHQPQARVRLWVHNFQWCASMPVQLGQSKCLHMIICSILKVCHKLLQIPQKLWPRPDGERIYNLCKLLKPAFMNELQQYMARPWQGNCPCTWLGVYVWPAYGFCNSDHTDYIAWCDFSDLSLPVQSCVHM